MATAKKKTEMIPRDSDKEAKKKALNTAIAQLERDFGAGSIMKLGENSALEVQAVSTGSISLDLALGIGGVPRGRIIEIFGPESSGKTTVALHIIAEVQKQGGEAAFIDAEHALDPVYAKALGVDINNLLVSQPDCGEDALDITEALVRSGAIDVVVIDSVAALGPRQEIEGDMGQSQVGVQARLMSQAMRKLSAVISKSNSVVIFINQLRDKVGVMYLGQMVEFGEKKDIFENPLHPYTKALFSAIPNPNPDEKMNRIVLKGDIPSPTNPPKGCRFHTRCPYATEKCKHVSPEYREYESGHFAACHLLDGE